MEPNKFMLLAAKHVKGVRNALALTQKRMHWPPIAGLHRK